MLVTNTRNFRKGFHRCLRYSFPLLVVLEVHCLEDTVHYEVSLSRYFKVARDLRQNSEERGHGNASDFCLSFFYIENGAMQDALHVLLLEMLISHKF
jgi:hypothetical protein